MIQRNHDLDPCGQCGWIQLIGEHDLNGGLKRHADLHAILIKRRISNLSPENMQTGTGAQMA